MGEQAITVERVGGVAEMLQQYGTDRIIAAVMLIALIGCVATFLWAQKVAFTSLIEGGRKRDGEKPSLARLEQKIDELTGGQDATTTAVQELRDRVGKQNGRLDRAEQVIGMHSQWLESLRSAGDQPAFHGGGQVGEQHG